MMNGAELHLLLNHLPVIIPLVGTPLIAMGLVLKPAELKEVGAWLLILGAVFAIPVYLTGEPAQAVVQNYPDISRTLIGDHQASAKISLIVMEAVGLLSLFFVYGARTRKVFTTKTWSWGALLLFSLASFGLMARTAHLGGVIRHEEIRTSDRF